ncbi:MAG TPA: helix-turn-helix transcriptional regulator [Tenuifilaceae bacterium]|jgi:transcriptional regulator with XRE-family HTH domain|nr:helix-turn-helix transcriptional regulator [Tenuifilaceae bacterium]
MSIRNFDIRFTQQERERLGQRVKILRENEGLTQEQLANEVGISKVRIWEVETAQKDYRIDTLLAILKYFGKTLNIRELK